MLFVSIINNPIDTCMSRLLTLTLHSTQTKPLSEESFFKCIYSIRYKDINNCILAAVILEQWSMKSHHFNERAGKLFFAAWNLFTWNQRKHKVNSWIILLKYRLKVVSKPLHVSNEVTGYTWMKQILLHRSYLFICQSNRYVSQTGRGTSSDWLFENTSGNL